MQKIKEGLENSALVETIPGLLIIKFRITVAFEVTP